MTSNLAPSASSAPPVGLPVKTLRHLVIGAGNMGKRHGSILESLGDQIRYEDLGFDPNGYDYRTVDSVLICTPAKTHLDFVSAVANQNSDIPVFIEKPVIDSLPCNLPGILPDISMVACNWRWCECIDPTNEILCAYRTDQLSAALDQIHFYDWFCSQNGEPERGIFIQGLGGNRMELSRGDKWLSSSILYDGTIQDQAWWGRYDSQKKKGYHKPLHSYGMCPMFVQQMITWRQVVAREIVSPNPIPLAIDRTLALLRLMRAGKVEGVQSQCGPSSEILH